MKLSPSGESAMERVHSDALLVQKEMGWIDQLRCALRVDVGIDPYEAEVRNRGHLIRHGLRRATFPSRGRLSRLPPLGEAVGGAD